MDERQNSSACRASSVPTTSAVPSRDLPDEERRRLLTTMGGVGVTVLAGCLGDGESDAASYTVVFLDRDGRTEVEISEDKKLLYPALDAGVDIPYACQLPRPNRLRRFEDGACVASSGGGLHARLDLFASRSDQQRQFNCRCSHTLTRVWVRRGA